MLEEYLRSLEELGWFEALPAELAASLRQALRSAETPGRPWAGLSSVSLAPDGYHGADDYRQLLQGVARDSHGCFTPRNLRVDWRPGGRRGQARVEVRFECGQRNCSASFQQDGDALAGELVELVRASLRAGSGLELHPLPDNPDSWFLAAPGPLRAARAQGLLPTEASLRAARWAAEEADCAVWRARVQPVLQQQPQSQTTLASVAQLESWQVQEALRSLADRGLAVEGAEGWRRPRPARELELQILAAVRRAPVSPSSQALLTALDLSAQGLQRGLTALQQRGELVGDENGWALNDADLRCRPRDDFLRKPSQPRPEGLERLAVSPDGSQLLARDQRQLFWLWSLARRRFAGQAARGSLPLQRIGETLADSAQVVALWGEDPFQCLDSRGQLYQLVQGRWTRRTRQPVGAGIYSAQPCAQTGRVYAALADGTKRSRGRIETYDGTSGKILASWQAHETPVDFLFLEPGGEFLLSRDREGTLKRWRTGQRQQPEYSLQLPGELAAAPDGRLLACAAATGVRLVDVATGQPRAELPLPDGVPPLLTAVRRGSFDAQAWLERQPSVRLVFAGEQLLACFRRADIVAVYAVDGLRRCLRLPIAQPITCLAPVGHEQLALGNRQGELILMDLADGRFHNLSAAEVLRLQSGL